jgi:hypothetical protein
LFNDPDSEARRQRWLYLMYLASFGPI